MSKAVEDSDNDERRKTVRLGPREISIPAEWDAMPFEEAIEINPRYNKPGDGPFDYLPMDAVDEDKQTIEYWTEREKDDCTSTWFKNGDTVYAKITPSTENGKIAFVEGLETVVGSGSTEFLVFHPQEGVTEERFVYYLSNLPDFRSVTISLMEGSTGRQRVPTDAFKGGIEVPLPPLPEQRRISAILSTVDDQIQQVDKIIEKTEELKRGLAQDLYGDGASDDQFPDRASELPEDWSLSPISKLCDIGGGKTPSKSNDDYWGGTILWASPKDFDGPLLDDTEDKITEFGVNDTSLKTYTPGNIAVVVRSGVLQHTLPVAKLTSKSTVNQDVKVLQPDTDAINPEYFFQILRTQSNKIRQRCMKTGTTVESIETSFLEKYKLRVPPQEKQQEIGGILSNLDNKIRLEQDYLSRLKELKHGLMQDLLTGKVRVTVDN